MTNEEKYTIVEEVINEMEKTVDNTYQCDKCGGLAFYKAAALAVRKYYLELR